MSILPRRIPQAGESGSEGNEYSMISAWHLLWIIPLAASAGVFWLALLMGSREKEQEE